MTQQKTTLVLGGTGKTGRRVARRLGERGLPVRIGSRSAHPPFDWEDQATWTPALRDAGSAYVTYYPDVSLPQAPGAIRSFTEQALACGVRRLVMLSGRGEETAEVCEKIIQGSGAEWTIIRASWFAQNFSEDYLLEPVVSGEVALPAGDIAEPFVDVGDIADIAVAALTGDRHVGRLYEVTGPRPLTFADAIAEIAKATGRNLRFVQVSPEQYATTTAAQGVPAEVSELLTYLFTTVLDGRNARVTDGVRRALGRQPRDFADYARDAAATGVWDV